MIAITALRRSQLRAWSSRQKACKRTSSRWRLCLTLMERLTHLSTSRRLRARRIHLIQRWLLLEKVTTTVDRNYCLWLSRSKWACPRFLDSRQVSAQQVQRHQTIGWARWNNPILALYLSRANRSSTSRETLAHSNSKCRSQRFESSLLALVCSRRTLTWTRTIARQ